VKYLQITVNTPIDYSDKVRDAMSEAGAGRIGNYSNCSFSTKGIGHSLPNEGANPAIGKIGKIELIEEERILTFCKEEDLEKVIEAIRSAHPYEEPLITYWPVEII
jgi:hypothetical protein